MGAGRPRLLLATLPPLAPDPPSPLATYIGSRLPAHNRTPPRHPDPPSTQPPVSMEAPPHVVIHTPSRHLLQAEQSHVAGSSSLSLVRALLWGRPGGGGVGGGAAAA